MRCFTHFDYMKVLDLQMSLIESPCLHLVIEGHRGGSWRGLWRVMEGGHRGLQRIVMEGGHGRSHRVAEDGHGGGWGE